MRKINLTESQLNIIEHHSQQVFNFDDNGEAYYEKDNWEHFVDYLEEIGRHGTLPSTKWTYHDILIKIKETLESVEMDSIDIEEIEEDNLYAVTEILYNAMTNLNYYELDELIDEEEFLNGFTTYMNARNDSPDTNAIYEFIERFDPSLGFLSKLGSQVLDDVMEERFRENINDYNMLELVEVNDRGLIYAERDITIPSLRDRSMDKGKYGYDLFYDYLNSEYGHGIGTYFSWAQNGAVAYNQNYYDGGSIYVKLRCWADPDTVDWDDTVYKNCYSMRDEKELSLLHGSTVEVFDVRLNGGQYGKKYDVSGIDVSNSSLINKPLLLPV